MCGICGFIQREHYDESVLRKMNETIRYRGPDDEGYLLEDIAPQAEEGQPWQA